MYSSITLNEQIHCIEYLLHHLEDCHFNSTFVFHVSDQIAVKSPISVSLPSLVLDSLTALLLILYCLLFSLFIWASMPPQCLLFLWYIWRSVAKFRHIQKRWIKMDCGLIDHVVMCDLKLHICFYSYTAMVHFDKITNIATYWLKQFNDLHNISIHHVLNV